MSVLSAWSTVCQALEAVAAQSLKAADSGCDSLTQSLHTAAALCLKLTRSPELISTNRQAVLTELVIVRKVPLRLCSAISKIVQKQKYTASQSHCLSTDAALRILNVFLHTHRICHLKNSLTSTSTDNIAAAIQQQVKQSGLLQTLPTVTCNMNSAIAASTVQQKGMPSAAAGEARSATGAVHSSKPVHIHQEVQVFKLATAVLQLQTQLTPLWAPATSSFSNMAPSARKALELAHTTLGNSDSLVKQGLGACQQDSLCSTGDSACDAYLPVLRQVLLLQEHAQEYVVALAKHLTPATPGSICEPLLASPHLLPCAAITCAAMALAEPTNCQAEALATGIRASTRRDSSSCDQDSATQGQQKVTTSLTAQTAQHWWQLAEQLLVQLSTCQLKLLELLGVDARVMLWFAQAIEHTTCKQQSFVVPASLQALAQLFVCRLDSWQSQPSQVQHMPAAQRQLECKLHLLLPTVLLPHAVQASNNGTGGSAAAALQLCWESLEGWGWLCVRPGILAVRMCWAAHRPPAAWVAEVLPQVLQLTDHWLQAAAASSESCSTTSITGDDLPMSAGVSALGHTACAVRIVCCLLAHCCPQEILDESRFVQLARSTREDCFPQATEAEAAASAAAAADMAELAAVLGEPNTSKQRKLLERYSPPGDKRMAQLLATFERFVRVLGAEMSAGAWHGPQVAVWCDSALGDIGYVAFTLTGMLADSAHAAGSVGNCSSPKHDRLHSLLCSLLKLQTFVLQARAQWADKVPWVQMCMLAVYSTMEHLLPQQAPAGMSLGSTGDIDHISSRSSSSSSGLQDESLATSASADQQVGCETARLESAAGCSQSTGSATGLRALAMFGRCCSLLSVVQQDSEAFRPTVVRDGSVVPNSRLTWRPCAPAAICFQTNHCTKPAHGEPAADPAEQAAAAKGRSQETMLSLVAATALAWISQSSTAQQLAGMGLVTAQEIKQQLAKLQEAAVLAPTAAAAAVAKRKGKAKGKAAEAVFDSLRQQLQATGVALSSLPVPVACNSPSCLNMTGPSELALVSGRSCVCGGCKVAYYCCRDCQRQHWKQHKPVCAALAAAAAPAAVDASAA